MTLLRILLPRVTRFRRPFPCGTASGPAAAGTVRQLARVVTLVVTLVAALAAAGLGAAPARAASFDCSGAQAPDEAAVCTNCDLAQQDVKMATLYGVLTKLVAMGQRGLFQDEQRTFLRHRAACKGDVRCLSGLYKTRIGELEKALEDIYSRGPF